MFIFQNLPAWCYFTLRDYHPIISSIYTLLILTPILLPKLTSKKKIKVHGSLVCDPAARHFSLCTSPRTLFGTTGRRLSSAMISYVFGKPFVSAMIFSISCRCIWLQSPKNDTPKEIKQHTYNKRWLCSWKKGEEWNIMSFQVAVLWGYCISICWKSDAKFCQLNVWNVWKEFFLDTFFVCLSDCPIASNSSDVAFVPAGPQTTPQNKKTFLPSSVLFIAFFGQFIVKHHIVS